MKQAYRRWACGLLTAILLLLAACAAIVYIVDPCLYYRLPSRWQPVFFSERYQGAGLLRNVEADTVLMGSSMAANYRAGQIEEVFGGSAVRVTIPDGYFSEFDKAMDVLFRSQSPERVIFALDTNILTRDESGVTEAMPNYLYNASPLDDVKYLLNKDTLYYSAYVLMANGWDQGQTVDEGFTWDKDEWWNHQAALEEYTRPEIEVEPLPADAFLADTNANLLVMEGWLSAHPETEFDIFLSPYSILYWDKTIRQGRTEAVFTALAEACQRLLQYDNVRLHGMLFDREIIENLDNYCDYVHHSGDVCNIVLKRMASGQLQLTTENLEKTLADWQTFVVNYDYEKFWDMSFWIQWNEEHPIT